MTARARIHAALFLVGCLAAFAASQWLLSRARHVPEGSVRIAGLVPSRFGGWTEVPSAFRAVDPSQTDDGDDLHALYDAVQSRAYRRTDDAEVMLTLAYRRVQEQESKIHRPELCYFAQGYLLGHKQRAVVPVPDRRLPAITFQAQGGDRNETVLYWIRIGDTVSTSAWLTRTRLFQLGIGGIVPDGILVRASIVSTTPPTEPQIEANRRVLREFLAAVVRALPRERRWMLIGGRQAIAAADPRP